ncbi:hypothetical protein BDZ89DRAFT_1165535 [Hymenopellis radicata]|nr:hypothetical protein BDZ89DRAFT_1165535 [Hymenopellis radicata]
MSSSFAMPQSLLTHRKRFNALKTKSLVGDASATSELDLMCRAHEVGTLAEIMPIVKRHLHTLPPSSSEVDGRMESPQIRNTLSTMTLLTHFLGKEAPDASVLDRLCVLCPFLEDWVSFLFRCMEIPNDRSVTPFPASHSVVVRDISLLLLALFSLPSISSVFSTSNQLILLIRDTWIWASDLGHDHVSIPLGGLLGVLSQEDEPELPVSEKGVYKAILARPIDVGKAVVQSLVQSLDSDLLMANLVWLHHTLAMVFRIRRRNDDARRSMIANDVLRWLCVLACRFTTMQIVAARNQMDIVGRIILLIAQEIGVFIGHTHDGFRIALRHHLIESLFRLEPFLYSTDVFRSTDSFANERHTTFSVIISQFKWCLIFRSCLPLIRRSVHDVEDMHLCGGLQRGGEVETIYRQFLDALTVREDWIDRYSSSEARRCFCVNPTCPCKTSSSVLCPTIMKKCTGCSFATYCSRACQKEHWSLGGHRIHCARLQSARAGGTRLLPVSPKDTEMIYALIRYEMAGRPDLFTPPDSATDSYHLRKEWPAENRHVVFRFDFGSSFLSLASPHFFP